MKQLKKNLLPRDKFMPEMHLKQPEFTYSVNEPLIQRMNTKIQRNRRFNIYIYIYR